MKVYTIQTLAFYEELIQNGIVYCNRESWVCQEFRFQYDWMAEQMRKRIGDPTIKEIKYPIWVWLQYESKKKPAPKMSPSEIAEGEEMAVMLELDVPEDAVLLSDFMLWHLPLNRGAICSKLEDKQIDKCDSVTKMERIISTWNRVFDLKLKDPYISTTARKNRSIQGTMWLLRKEWLQVAHIFNRHSETKRIIY